MPIPERRRKFLHHLGFLGRDEDGNEILLGLSIDETDEYFRLYESHALRFTRWFLELDRKHLAAWQIQQSASRYLRYTFNISTLDSRHLAAVLTSCSARDDMDR